MKAKRRESETENTISTHFVSTKRSNQAEPYTFFSRNSISPSLHARAVRRPLSFTGVLFWIFENLFSSCIIHRKEIRSENKVFVTKTLSCQKAPLFSRLSTAKQLFTVRAERDLGTAMSSFRRVPTTTE